MSECRHTNILIITKDTKRLRCRHCHLTLKAEEIQGGYCPECMAETGIKRAEFEDVDSGEKKLQYRCEDCGAMLISSIA